MPENVRMKGKKLAEPRNLVRLKLARPDVKEQKMATGGSPFAPSRIPPVNQPKI
jgi:hypothetical protein